MQLRGEVCEKWKHFTDFSAELVSVMTRRINSVLMQKGGHTELEEISSMKCTVTLFADGS